MKRRTLAFIFAGLLALLSLAGLVHAFTPEDEIFATPQLARVAAVGPYFAGV